jgi:very-short-patch-repair endonuclease
MRTTKENNQMTVRGRYPNIEIAARNLRKRQTPAEKLLWQALRGRQVQNLKFRRQHPIDIFIADFYCAQARLVIELDGGVHKDRAEQDALRTKHLEALGYRVIRFPNQLIFSNITLVINQILLAAQESPHPDMTTRK